MPLPHFHTMPLLIDPIMANDFQLYAITDNDDFYIIDVRDIDLNLNSIILHCYNNHSMQKNHISSITINKLKRIKYLIFSNSGRVKNYITQVLDVELLDMESNWSYENVDMSIITTKFKINSSEDYTTDDVNSIVRDIKLRKIL